jgi:nicotinate-nucleotide adenylyltransferase
MSRRVGLLGGTFDPIHLGHLSAARAAETALALDTVWFIPTRRPPHRPDSPLASGYHRLQMTALAVAGEPAWRASDIEFGREGASYTFDTLTTLRQEDPTSQFFFITGADAFAEIAEWRRYPDVLDLAHFVVIARTGTGFDGLKARLHALRERMVELGDPPPSPPPSPSSPTIFLVHAATPDVSSTEIRRRAASGESLEGLVPDPVARYIREHHLYA